MVFQSVTLHLAARGFRDDLQTPKTHVRGQNGCMRLALVDGGVLIEGETSRFWTPLTNVVWAEPAPEAELAGEALAPSPLTTEYVHTAADEKVGSASLPWVPTQKRKRR